MDALYHRQYIWAETRIEKLPSIWATKWQIILTQSPGLICLLALLVAKMNGHSYTIAFTASYPYLHLIFEVFYTRAGDGEWASHQSGLRRKVNIWWACCSNWEKAADIWGQQFWCYLADMICSISNLFIWSDSDPYYFSSLCIGLTCLENKCCTQPCHCVSEWVESDQAVRKTCHLIPAFRTEYNWIE